VTLPLSAATLHKKASAKINIKSRQVAEKIRIKMRDGELL
jgi:hypothetical protein